MSVLPPPLSRAHREHYTEQARAVKDSLDLLLAEVDDALELSITPE